MRSKLGAASTRRMPQATCASRVIAAEPGPKARGWRSTAASRQHGPGRRAGETDDAAAAALIDYCAEALRRDGDPRAQSTRRGRFALQEPAVRLDPDGVDFPAGGPPSLRREPEAEGRLDRGGQGVCLVLSGHQVHEAARAFGDRERQSLRRGHGRSPDRRSTGSSRRPRHALRAAAKPPRRAYRASSRPPRAAQGQSTARARPSA